ncbi:conserved exported protein of unknown function [Nitrospira sp. KM1]|uniref:hypothetical protein n=1 Tax=Nitrospira sp. KM1 TaxID=1936990 RepID=UPI0013A74958|nr:hypothetical protein [Nitrospira sp. KM1]BCA55792.1 conserved exported protein of unknown function [Nitrospira sp. KM1]
MDNEWMRSVARVLCMAGVLAVVGCGGSGQTVHVDVTPKQVPAQMAEPEAVKIVIEPFEDRRVEKNRVGMRSHLWGGVTYFNVTGEKPGEMYAKAMAERLRTRGWHDRSWDARVAPAGSATDADIVITGQILDVSANAKSRVFSTALTTSSKLTISARNNTDRTVTNRTIEGAQSDTVFWFSEEDVKKLLTATVKDTLDRYLEDTKISQRAVRPSR